MSNLDDMSFDEDTNSLRNSSYLDKKRGFVSSFVIKLGLAKDDKGANNVLLVVIVLLILITFAVFIFSPGTQEPSHDINILPDESVGVHI